MILPPPFLVVWALQLTETLALHFGNTTRFPAYSHGNFPCEKVLLGRCRTLGPTSSSRIGPPQFD